MVSDKVFNTDGTQKVFSSDFAVISEDHIRVFLDGVVVSRDDYDLINNAAVFSVAPTAGQVATVQVGTTPGDILTAPTDAGTVAANIADVNTVAGISGDVSTVASITANIAAVVADEADIGVVAADIANVNTVATDIDNVNAVVGNQTNIDAVVTNEANINLVAGNQTNIDAAVANEANINAAVANEANINSAVANTTNINAAVANTTNINAAVANEADIDAVVANEANITAVATNEANVNIVAGIGPAGLQGIVDNEANINSVGTDIANVNTTATNIADVNTTATNIANVNTVASNISNVNAVQANEANINAVQANATNINAVQANEADIDTVAGINANVTTVAGIASDVTAAATNIADITAVASEVAKVVDVANDLNETTSEIDTVANAIANVDTVGTNIANVNAVATNIADVNSFADTYFTGATAPATPTSGDLWFDTAANTMKVYGSAGWANAGSSVNGVDNSVEHTATAGQTSFTATYDPGYLNVFLNGVKLDSSDYTATDGANVVLDTGATVGDSLFVQAFGTFALADHYSKIASDARYLQLTGGTLTGDLTAPNFIGNLDGSIASGVKNGGTTTLVKGTPVYQTSTSGNLAVVEEADASSASTMPAIGVLAQDLTAGQEVDTGGLIHLGFIQGVDTSSFSEGETIYVAVGGGYTNVQPTGEGNLLQNLGKVLKVHATNGSGIVMGAGRSNATPNLNDGNVFIGNVSNQSEARALTVADTTGLQTALDSKEPADATILKDADIGTSVLAPNGDGSQLTGIEGVPSGIISMWSGSSSAIPSGWNLCDGTNGTPNLVGRFIKGASTAGGTGGSGTTSSNGSHTHSTPSHSHSHSLSAGSHTLSTSQMPSHNHSLPTLTGPTSCYSSFKVLQTINQNGNCGPTQGWSFSTASAGGGSSHSHSLSGSITSGGSGTSGSNGSHTHTIEPSYFELCYIMKS